MDKRVLIILITVVVVLASLLTVIYILKDKECERPLVTYEAHPRAGQPLKFTCTNCEGKSIEWIFSNGKSSLEVNPVISFDVANTYSVTAKFEDKCDTVFIVQVEAPKEKDRPRFKISVPQKNIHVGDNVTFSDGTPGSGERIWSIRNNDKDPFKEQFKGSQWITSFSDPKVYFIRLFIKGEDIEGDTTFRIKVFKTKTKQENGNDPWKEVSGNGSGTTGGHPPVKDKKHPPSSCVQRSGESFKEEFIRLAKGLNDNDDALMDRWGMLYEDIHCENKPIVDVLDEQGQLRGKETIYGFHNSLLNRQFEVKNVIITTRKRSTNADGECTCFEKIVVTVGEPPSKEE